MDFARKQLEKYGWTDGKGLGKHENGISEALKPKLKRSVTGIGHDPASEFNEHWWTTLYNKAAGNIEVKEKNNKTKKIKAKKEFEITNSTWKLNNDNTQSKGNYSGSFVRTAVLTNGGSKVENVREDVEVESVIEKKDVFQMTDEELFKACEGRTAHKGARHGLKALGKLARIAQQEEMLLNQPQYNGYSKGKSNTEEVVETMSLEIEEEVKTKKKKKKKRRLTNNEIENIMQSIAIEEHVIENYQSEPQPTRKSKKVKGDISVENEDGIVKKAKKNKLKEHIEENEEVLNEDKCKKKKKRKKGDRNDTNIDENTFVKKKKCK